MPQRFAFTIVLLGALLTMVAPAVAVDRSLGADVPKPQASGEPRTDAEIAALNANLGIALAGSSALRGAHVGILAVDARDGRVLFQRNADELFQPASTSKLIVGSAILDALGPAYRFHTDAVMSGSTLIVRAGGDPFLKDADFDGLATALAAKGVHALGQVAFDVSRYEGPNYPPGWSWDDFPYYYAPQIGALSFEENVVHLTVTPGDAVDAKATVASAPIPLVGTPIEGCAPGTEPIFVPQAKTAAAGAKSTADVTRDGLGCTYVVGSVPIGGKPDTFDAAVPYPTVYAWKALQAALQRHGITTSFSQLSAANLHLAAAPADAQVVWTHDSEPLADVLADLFFPSDNLVAEMLLRELGVPRPPNPPGPGTTAGGLAAEKTWLKSINVDPDTVAMADGSGLSGYDRVTPSALVAILAHDWNGPNRDVILDDLPIAGVRGTLKRSFLGTPAERHVFAKTGGLSHVNTLAGYVATAKHGTVIFAFQVDDWNGDGTALRELRARVLSRFVTD
ncbi:MAG TPA: D-alanyl-D-alanine carboxypeptidase/D-alanyl-D-alanine-endopeptidase [Candidatus Elarobacter sp.]